MEEGRAAGAPEAAVEDFREAAEVAREVAVSPEAEVVDREAAGSLEAAAEVDPEDPLAAADALELEMAGGR